MTFSEGRKSFFCINSGLMVSRTGQLNGAGQLFSGRDDHVFFGLRSHWCSDSFITSAEVIVITLHGRVAGTRVPDDAPSTAAAVLTTVHTVQSDCTYCGRHGCQCGVSGCSRSHYFRLHAASPGCGWRWDHENMPDVRRKCSEK